MIRIHHVIIVKIMCLLIGTRNIWLHTSN